MERWEKVEIRTKNEKMKTKNEKGKRTETAEMDIYIDEEE